MDKNLIDALQNAAEKRRKRTISIFAIGLCVALLGISPLFVKFIVVIKASSPYELKSLKVNFEEGRGISLGHRLLVFSDLARIEIKYDGHYAVDALITAATATLNIEPKPKPGFLALKSNSQLVEALVDGVDVLQLVSAGKLKLKAGSHYLQVANRECGRFATQFSLRPEKTLLLEPAFEKTSIPLNITSDPIGAEVVSCGRVIGTTPLSGTFELSDDLLRVNKAGFRSEMITAGVASVTLEPYIRIPIELNPAGGVLSGALHSWKDSTLELKERLPVRLKYEAVGYAPQKFEITSAKQKIRISLEKITAPLHVSTNVPSSVFLDGKFVGKSPVSILMEYGDRILSVTASGYKSQDKTIPVRSEQAINAEIELEGLSSYRLRTSPREYVPSGMNSALVRVAGSELELGSRLGERGSASNEVRKKVLLSREFYMGVAEVSEAEFSAYSSGVNSSQKPITDVSWFDAARFCNWLSVENDLQPFYRFDENGDYLGINRSSVGFRLPTEAEWEYVAGKYRRSTKSVFVWGDRYRLNKLTGNIADISAKKIAKTHAATYNDGYAELAPVSSGESVNGFLNFSGNAAEWVTDTYVLEYPSQEQVVDPIETVTTGSHTVKGSSFLSSDWRELRIAFRDSFSGGREDIGFRIARYVN